MAGDSGCADRGGSDSTVPRSCSISGLAACPHTNTLHTHVSLSRLALWGQVTVDVQSLLSSIQADVMDIKDELKKRPVAVSTPAPPPILRAPLAPAPPAPSLQPSTTARPTAPPTKSSAPPTGWDAVVAQLEAGVKLKKTASPFRAEIEAAETDRAQIKEKAPLTCFEAELAKRRLAIAGNEVRLSLKR